MQNNIYPPLDTEQIAQAVEYMFPERSPEDIDLHDLTLAIEWERQGIIKEKVE